MINMFKKIVFFIGFFIVLLARAGSYDDFFKAVTFDDVKTVQGLLQRGFDPNTVDTKARPALVLAIQEPSPKVAELLIQWPGTQINVRNPSGETPLMMAALRGQVLLVEMLIDKKATIHHAGWTPLHYAATGGHTAIVDLLIKHGAAVNAESPNGTTPLMMAARYGSAHAVKTLIQSGADLLKQNQQGLTAFDFAVQGGLPDNQALMRQGLARLKIYPPTKAR